MPKRWIIRKCRAFTLSPWPEEFAALRELYLPHLSAAALRRGQGRLWERWIKAHILGHFVLHVGDQTVLPRSFVTYQEKQANEFAGWFIIGEPRDLWQGFPLTTWKAAELARVPDYCLARWWATCQREDHVRELQPMRWF